MGFCSTSDVITATEHSERGREQSLEVIGNGLQPLSVLALVVVPYHL